MGKKRGPEWITFVEEMRAFDREPEFYACLDEWRGDAVSARKSMVKAAQESSLRIELGIERYVWKLAIPDLACVQCKERGGKVFSFASPPPGGNPGEAPGCMCFAFPIIPGFD